MIDTAAKRFMTKLEKILRISLALAVVMFGSRPTRATTVIPPTFEEMTDRAELIIVGKVINTHAEWRVVGTHRVIFTLVEFEKTEVLKGEAGASVTLQFLGGTVGDVTMEISGVPTFSAGDREFLFVKGNGIQFCPVVGVFHGKFGVRKDQKTGRDILVRHNGDALRDVTEIGAGAVSGFGPNRAQLSIAADAEPISLDDFKSKVRARVAIGAQKK